MKCPSCGYKLRSSMKRRKPVHKWRGEHEYLATSLEKLKRRMEVYRAAGGEVALIDEDYEDVEDLRTAYCQGCAETHPLGWLEGEWHHACTLKKKCDSVKCALWVCPMIHRLTKGSIHRRNPEWGEK